MVDPFEGLTKVHSGRRRHTQILESPLRREIDDRLFRQHLPVKQVAESLKQQGVQNISYASLVRYKHSVLASKAAEAADPRAEGVRRDLGILSSIVDRGEDSMRAGTLPTMAQMLRAIELRAHIFAALPDTSAALKDEYDRTLKVFADAVRELLTPEQNLELRQLLSVAFGPKEASHD